MSLPTEGMQDLSIGGKGTAKRDALRANELKVQAMWEECRAFESNHNDNDGEEKNKFMVTFPYPYSNGHLHIGHAFSLTKAVFRAQFERHLGKNVLFPFAFHCTGMPIQAAANKLKAEISEFGIPPQFPEEDPEVRKQMEEQLVAQALAKAAKNIDKKAKGGKTKLVSKTGTGIVRQWNILLKMVPVEDIPAFVDPFHWLMHFPPIGVDHLKRFGAGIDWRRAFITTAVNPYYDAFIRWQFNTLRRKGKVLFGKRNNVYSILDGQVCADHDRSEGEGDGPQEYVLIKLEVLPPTEYFNQPRHAKMSNLLATLKQKQQKLYFVPATLRPETMYGQTNCFVLPTGEYGAYYVDATNEVFVMSARSARGLSCQLFDNSKEGQNYYTKEFAQITCLETFTGDELLGLPLRAPLAKYDVIYTLPLLTISMGKGTGVVCSVPSDAPDDYVALKTMQDKPDYCAKFDILPEMVEPFAVVPIISVEGYGEACAVTVCERLKIKSSKDTAKLAQAKDETYLKGFTSGIMTVGPYAGKKVSDAKPIIKQEMIDAGQACIYFEPESRVMSRTNDECVVAATDQWYLAYGEESWRSAVTEHVLDPTKFNAYDDMALAKYDYSIGWLKEWACTRQFGLGTQLPWDKKWVIESLSDSTIYMAYYTISHILQGYNNINGDKEKSPFNVDPEHLTDSVFDYIYYNDAPLPTTEIPKEVLDQCRNEFRYWYPLDLRVSAKDLIPNHLTMALYNHAAIWDNEPDLWPRGYYTNGHVLVDAEKMSKSKGNFLMMDQTVEQFSADATRFACADAGDSLDDANFARESADSAIMSLINEETWIKETLTGTDLREDTNYNFMDRVLTNETNRLIQATHDSYTAMQFREGLQHGWFEMLLARNEYRAWCQDSKTPMNRNVLTKWAQSLLILVCPVCPHWAETMWTHGLFKSSSKLAVKAPWPTADAENKVLTREAKFLRDSIKNYRMQVSKAKKGWKTATILVTDSYPQWKIDTLLWMQDQYKDGKFSPTFMKDLKQWSTKSVTEKKLIKLIMQFASFNKREVEDVGSVAMETTLPFDQKAIIEGSENYIKSQLNLENVSVLKLDDDNSEQTSIVPQRIFDNVVPGKSYLMLL